MSQFAGLDVSIDEAAVCVVDEGVVLMQCSVATGSEVITKALSPFAATRKRVGHEARALSPWLQPALLASGVPAVCMETRQVRATMSAQRNKNDPALKDGIDGLRAIRDHAQIKRGLIKA